MRNFLFLRILESLGIARQECEELWDEEEREVKFMLEILHDLETR